MKTSKLVFSVVATLLFLQSPLHSMGIQETRKTGVLRLRHMDCFKTTEKGEDEVYFIVYAISARDGRILKEPTRVLGGQRDGGGQPDCKGHWNMNDRGSGSNRQIQNVEFWRGEIDLNESVIVTVLIMEEDGGLPATYVNLLAEEAKKINDPYVIAAAYAAQLAAKLADIQDSDDYIGGFTTTLTCALEGRTKRVRVTWDPKKDWDTMRGQDLKLEPPVAHKPRARKLSFTGDGSLYNLAVE